MRHSQEKPKSLLTAAGILQPHHMPAASHVLAGWPRWFFVAKDGIRPRLGQPAVPGYFGAKRFLGQVSPPMDRVKRRGSTGPRLPVDPPSHTCMAGLSRRPPGHVERSHRCRQRRHGGTENLDGQHTFRSPHFTRPCVVVFSLQHPAPIYNPPLLVDTNSTTHASER